jgi:hypothetical protein
MMVQKMTFLGVSMAETPASDTRATRIKHEQR